MNVKDFKNWLLENELEENDLFVESLICYNNRAYRAAYILSYLGFAEYIRNVIIEYDEVPLRFEEKIISEVKKMKSDAKTDFEHYITSNYPNEKTILFDMNNLSAKDSKVRKFLKEMWRKRVTLLKEDDKWDEEFKNLMLEADYNIFLLGKRIRDEFLVKKDLRNVCAHNKSRCITDATVEDLWDYIKYIKPFIVINGTKQLIIDNINNAIKFSNASEYEMKAKEIYKSYSVLGDGDRKSVFDKICDFLCPRYLMENKEFFCCLFEQIFFKRNCSEIGWIKKNIEAELFVKLNVNNYNCEINKAQLYEKLQSENTDSDVFPIGIVFEFFRRCTNDQKKLLFIKEIYNQENNYNHWLDLVISSDDENFYLQNEDILKIIIQKNHLNHLFEDIKRLYSYRSQYGTKTTNTLDYCSFGREKITRKVFLTLWLIKNNKITLTQDAEDLVTRCVNIVKTAQEYSNSNEAGMDRVLQRDKDIYTWICTKV